ncbi:MAG: MFS transporter [Candidatus Omnitrophica bacterium]|nr:MFS transporter [Candidatus Omnitrophota bacterium]
MFFLIGRVAWLAGLVYFVQGALGIAGIALPLYLRAQGFSVTKIVFISSVSSIPWFFKIIYGAISDAIPIWHLRRKPYLIIFSLLSSIGWVLLGILPPEQYLLIFSMMMANLGLAATDVITDGLIVEYSRKGTAQAYQSIAWGARSLGAVLSGFIGGILAAHKTPQSVFLITALLPLISFSAALFLREKPRRLKIKFGNVLAPILESIGRILHGELKWFLLLLLIVSNSVAVGTPLFFYMREILVFDEIALGVLGSITWVGATVGCLIFLNLFKRTSLRTSLIWAIGLGFMNILLALAIQNYPSAFAVSLLSGILGYLILLPLFSSAARLAHGSGVEGSLFAILMSVFNLGQAVASFWGGALYEWIGLKPLIVLTAFLVLPAFLVIPRLKSL